MKSTNIPEVKLGIVAVSRDCFPIQLSEKRRAAIVAACQAKGLDLYEAKTTVENEKDMEKAVAEVTEAGCNALTVFLGNFGPETPETLIAKFFNGPCMFVAAAEGDGDMINGRGDAYCGMLNCSYNLGMRHLKGYIPEYPIGTADEIADKMIEFVPIARTLLGVRDLKIITFGPRPQTSLPATHPSRACTSWALKWKRTASWTCWFPTKSMQMTRASRMSARIWLPRWAKATTIPTCWPAWLSLS